MRKPWNVVLILVTVGAIVFMAVVANHGQSSASVGSPQTSLLADTESVMASSVIATSSSSTVPIAPLTTKASPVTTSTTPKEKSTGKEPTPQVIIVTLPPAPAPLKPQAPTSTPSAAATSTNNKSASVTAVTLPYSVGTFGNSFGAADGWTAWWGGMAQSGGNLIVEGTPSSTGGGVSLIGSTAWADYTFQANVDWVKGQAFGLIARYVDDNNFVLCNFNETTVGTINMTIQKYINGKSTVIASGDIDNYEQAGGADIVAVIAVRGDEATCSFNGNTIASYDLFSNPSASQKGGIGFKAWDPQMNNSEIVVQNVGVVSGLYDAGQN